MSELPEIESRNPFHRANSLTELLSFDDLDFVRCAYVTVLGRQPDLLGEGHYVQQIRLGVSKYHVLRQLRQSSEAKQHDPGIAGLDRALKRAAWQRRPLLGALSRFLRSDAGGQSRSDQMLRSLENTASVNQRYLHAISERLSVLVTQTGLPASTSATPVPALEGGDRIQQAGTICWGRGMDPAQTPELDHLREKAVNGRYIIDVAP